MTHVYNLLLDQLMEILLFHDVSVQASISGLMSIALRQLFPEPPQQILNNEVGTHLKLIKYSWRRSNQLRCKYFAIWIIKTLSKQQI